MTHPIFSALRLVLLGVVAAFFACLYAVTP